MNFIYPKIDGLVTNYFEWMGAGYLEGKGHGVAMHESVSLIKGCYYGFNEDNLYLRLDVDKTFISDMGDVSFEINMMAKDGFKIFYSVKDNSIKSELPVLGMFSEVLELKIPFSAFGLARKEGINIWLSLKIKDMFVDRIPKRGYLVISIPSETFEAEMWYV